MIDLHSLEMTALREKCDRLREFVLDIAYQNLESEMEMKDREYVDYRGWTRAHARELQR